MSESDFSAALGRLLTEGPLREAFARDPLATAASLSEDEAVQAQLVALRAEDLEYQAGVLLRKRFDAAKRLLPGIMADLAGEAWPLFQAYGLNRWLQGDADALAFAEAVCPRLPGWLPAREINRLRFALASRRWSLHAIRLGRFRLAVQVLVRRKNGTWREMVLFLRF